MKENVVVIVGPTAVGKTKLSIDIASKFPSEIISGDSMQIYQGMDIGTGKITMAEMNGIAHYMIDTQLPNEVYSVATFQTDVDQYIKQINTQDKLPILVGGSGMYIDAVLYDYEFKNRKRDEQLTNHYESRMELEGIDVLYNELKQIDEVYASKVHPNNYRRVIRGLEVYESSGITMTEISERQKQTAKYNHIIIGLDMDRTMLYEQINNRVDDMITAGLIEEVRSLVARGYEDTQAMKAIGYKELIPFIHGEADLSTSVELLKRNSRRYAKRQYTWFKNKMQVNWYTITPETYEKQAEKIMYDLHCKFFED